MIALLLAACIQDVTREEFEKMKRELEALQKRGSELTPQERQEFDKMKKELDDLKKKVDEKKQEPTKTDGKTLPEKGQEDKDKGTVYSKPFLARFGRGVYLGGYIDLEFFNNEDNNNDTFDQHRFVPFIYADVSENIKVAAEIEIEHGSELGVEFAHVDYWLWDELNFRAGIVLNPLGKFNLVHDAPYQDLTNRPLVDTWIIPAVLREPGLGIFGTFDLDPWKIDYELYVTNGFKGLSKTGTNKISTTSGLRDARAVPGTGLGSSGRDFNDNKSVTGRVGVSPFLGVEFGLSMHVGKYDERGDNLLGIYAFDFTLDLGGIYNKFFSGEGFFRDLMFAMEIVGEFAVADIERDDFAKSKGVPNDFQGWFVEARYHFFFDSWREVIPGANDETTFTLVFRYDDTDLDNHTRRRVTLGFNFRLREDTVFKFEYSWNRESERLDEVDNDGFAFSVATYF